MDGRPLYVEAVGVVESLGNIFFGNFLHCGIFLVGSFYYLIVHVGEVLNVCHLISLVLKITSYRVKNNVGTRVSDMDIVIDRGAADIHFYLSGLHGHKFFLFSCKSIIDFHLLFSFILFTAAGF